MTYDQGIYNIGAVTRMTGIPASTLRIWERRYGFPKPERSDGQHRLYSERQVADLRRVKQQVDQGVRVGQAIRALEQIQEDVLPTTLPTEAAKVDMTRLGVLQEDLFSALMKNDLGQADALFLYELSTYAVEVQVLEVILPTLKAIGDAWENDEVSIATEHLASQYLRHRLALWALTSPPPFDVPPVVLACAPEELHEGGLLILTVLLQRRRWPVAYLGQSVPLGDLAQFVKDVRPLAVVLMATREETARALVDWPEVFSGAGMEDQVVVCFGGHVFVEQPEWRTRVPGVYLGDSLPDAVDRLEQLLVAAAPLPGFILA